MSSNVHDFKEQAYMFTLKNKVVLITGGSHGIGAALAAGFAEAGSTLAITYHSDKQAALKCVRNVKASGSECISVKVDVARHSDVRRAVTEVINKYGHIDVLVNNSGIWKGAEIGSMSEKEWDETMDVNLKGTFLFCNEIAPIMKRRKYGKIINISSTAGQRGEPGHSHYAASKGGVIAFTKSIAAELAPYNINANSVAPGWVETDMTSKTLNNKSKRKEIESGIPRGKVAKPQDIVGTVLFLASDLSSHIVGATINVNGGSVLF